MIKLSDCDGQFYPASSEDISSLLKELLDKTSSNEILPKALIAPHAGYIYSGEIAANAYKTLLNHKDKIENIILLSPAHRYPLSQVAFHSAQHFQTPLGKIEVNHKLIKSIEHFNFVNNINDAFNFEHALEVHLPFIQYLFKSVKIVPLIVGACSEDNIAEMIETLWNPPQNIIIVSSDLSHFHSYEKAQRIDQQTRQKIEHLNFSALNPDDAYGYYPLKGLIKIALKKELKVTALDLRNSGDTAGDKNRVVGYGSFAFS